MMKMALRTIVRENYEDFVEDWISEKGIESTMICALGSMLFLYKVKMNHFECNWDFFVQTNGDNLVKRCFYAVLHQNKENEDMSTFGIWSNRMESVGQEMNTSEMP